MVWFLIITWIEYSCMVNMLRGCFESTINKPVSMFGKVAQTVIRCENYYSLCILWSRIVLQNFLSVSQCMELYRYFKISRIGCRGQLIIALFPTTDTPTNMFNFSEPCSSTLIKILYAGRY